MPHNRDENSSDGSEESEKSVKSVKSVKSFKNKEIVEVKIDTVQKTKDNNIWESNQNFWDKSSSQK